MMSGSDIGGSAANSAGGSNERSQSPGQSKMSDILKRKVPPKRKSQTSNRSKSRQESDQSSVVQELINRATTLG